MLTTTTTTAAAAAGDETASATTTTTTRGAAEEQRRDDDAVVERRQHLKRKCDDAVALSNDEASDDDYEEEEEEEEDDRLILPRSVIAKVIKRVSGGARMSGESREVILLCCHEFVHALSNKASHLCESQHKKLIGADHVLAALKDMGLSDYVPECQETMRAAVEEAAEKRRRMNKAGRTQGWTDDDLYRHQMELFAQARQQVESVRRAAAPSPQKDQTAIATDSEGQPGQPPAAPAPVQPLPFSIEGIIRMMKPADKPCETEDYDADEDDNHSG